MKQFSIFLLSIIIFSSVSFSIAQDTTPNPIPTPPPLIEDDDEVLTIESRLVVVPVSVTDGNGNPIKGLIKENFRLKEENKKQEIAEVSAADKVPLEIALLIDISGTTNPMFKFEQETAAKFLQDVMRPQDRATIFTIGTFPKLLQSRNLAFQSIQTIKQIKPTKQSTAFYDTVSTAADYLKTNASPKSRKVIIVISDGEDQNSIGIKIGLNRIYAELDRQKHTLSPRDSVNFVKEKRRQVRFKEQSKTLVKIQSSDAVFYSVNPAGSSYKLNKISVIGQGNMQRFADETGGTAFLPKFLPIDLKSAYESTANLKRNTETLEKIFKQLASELQSQYVIQYYSDSEFPENKFVKLDVDLNLNFPQGVRVRSRQGYYVKNQ